jgi:hypothetical protein
MTAREAVHDLVGLAGLVVAVATMLSAVRTVVLPRAIAARIAKIVFMAMKGMFDARLGRVHTYEARDSVMASYAPFSLLALLLTWLLSVYAGFVAVFWGLHETWRDSLRLSGSSLLTLGFDRPTAIAGEYAAFTEATMGLVLLALLITFLPSLYATFSRREAAVAKLEVRAGSPPTGVDLLRRAWVIQLFDLLPELWRSWEDWFIELGETHTSLPALSYFRSPQPQHSWVTAAGALLDGAALRCSVVDAPEDVDAQLTLRAGYLALRRLCAFFELPYPDDPRPDDPISILREEFDTAFATLEGAGLPMKADREQAWRDFAGWRVNYDAPLLELATLTMAPYAPWSSDRSIALQRQGRA